jgi:hypothetical protein
MVVLLILVGIVVLLFASALLFGAPFLPTLQRQTKDSINLLNLKPGQTFLELGSGDGRVLKAAAQRGATVRGYEINPLLVIISMFRCLAERSLVTVRWGNFWHTSLSDADAIYVFLLKPYMAKLDKKITQEITKPIKVVSFTFAFPDRTPIKEQNGLMLYEFKPDHKKH